MRREMDVCIEVPLQHHKVKFCNFISLIGRKKGGGKILTICASLVVNYANIKTDIKVNGFGIGIFVMVHSDMVQNYTNAEGEDTNIAWCREITIRNYIVKCIAMHSRCLTIPTDTSLFLTQEDKKAG
jgi:hypothetical protein